MEYKEDHVSHSVYVSFKVDLVNSRTKNAALLQEINAGTGIELLVWTTTPWTLTSNMVSFSLMQFVPS